MLRNKSREFNTDTNSKESEEELLSYDVDQIENWLYKNDPSSLPNSVKEDWKEKAEDTNLGQKNRINALLDGKSVEDVMGLNKKLNTVKIYKQPSKEARDDTYEDGLEQSMTDADKFIEDGSNDKIDDLSNFQTQFGDIYNIVLQIGVGLAVIVGIVLGVKFILSSVEGKAEVKKMLITYVVSCVVIFGSFGIWKIVVTILQTV